MTDIGTKEVKGEHNASLRSDQRSPSPEHVFTFLRNKRSPSPEYAPNGAFQDSTLPGVWRVGKVCAVRRDRMERLSEAGQGGGSKYPRLGQF
jgi:hypothetical protein